jgi:hypothetical protein
MRIAEALIAVGLLAAQMALPGCASYQATGVPLVPEVMPYSHSDSYVEVRADPFLELDRQRKYFDAELTNAGVIPIQVFVRNKSEVSFALAYDAIWLELPDGLQIKRTPSTYFVDLTRRKAEWERQQKGTQQKEAQQREKQKEKGELATAGTALGAAFLGGLLALPAFMTAPIWGPIALTVHHSSEQARTDRYADYDKKELAAIVVGKDESRSGFVFFVIPADVDFAGVTNLVFSFVEEKSGLPTVISLPVKVQGEGAQDADSLRRLER